MPLWKNASLTSENFPSVRECCRSKSPQGMGDGNSAKNAFCLNISRPAGDCPCLFPWIGRWRRRIFGFSRRGFHPDRNESGQ